MAKVYTQPIHKEIILSNNFEIVTQLHDIVYQVILKKMIVQHGN